MATIRAVLIGDEGVGKTSLIIAAATDRFTEEPPPVLPTTRLPSELLLERVPVVVVDTSNKAECREALEAECHKADIIMVCYERKSLESLDRVGSYWLPELRHMEIRKPVIIVGCQQDVVESQGSEGDADDAEHMKQEQKLSQLIDEWREIEVCLQCSAKKLTQVSDVFSYAQKLVLHPTEPLYDAQYGQLKPACINALKRIFKQCDMDRDGFLSDKELNYFQLACFGTPLQPEELQGVKKIVQDRHPDGVHLSGITFKGFVYLHAIFIERGRMDTTWTVLRKFGYDNTLHLREDLTVCSHQASPDQVIELSEKGTQFFRQIFNHYDRDEDGVLSPTELEDIFSTSPSNPWSYDLPNITETSSSGSLTRNGFLCMWDLTTMNNPRTTIAYLRYLGFAEDPNTALQVSKRRKNELKRGILTRNVINCFVFGAADSNSHYLLSSLIGKPFSSTSASDFALARIAYNGSEKTLIMHQYTGENAYRQCQSRGEMARCDIALFAYDGCNKESFDEAVSMLKHAEQAGSGCLPCVLVVTTNELDDQIMKNSLTFTNSLEMVNPFHMSPNVPNTSHVFLALVKIALAVESIPQTAQRRAQAQYQAMIRKVALGLVVGTTVVWAGLWAMKVYSNSNTRSKHDDNV